MPELPDVEIWKRYIDATSLHEQIEDVDVKSPRMLCGVTPVTLRRRLKGASFEQTARHGKYLFIAVAGDGWLLLHLGMTGRFAYDKSDGSLPKHTGLVIRFSNGCRLSCVWERKLGRISLVESPAAFIQDQGLGPDAPSPELAELREMLTTRRGSVKAALMDQKFVAGIGNIYSDEILFQAGIHPQSPASQLDDPATAALHRALGRVFRIAIERKADPEQLPRSWLLPHREKGGTCPRCGSALDRITTGGRHGYFCPQCQARRQAVHN